ncbi:MAG: ketoacyl-ACP synthase III [Candidatus Omnitrophica bacterium]|nr:ketoacyl-ACP synthase III [Candidatus Omnitrophota bacterium]MCM8797884.1 ketoacyl-ACP synthase III [Candidatus Omnitrophota bacterium]
MKKERVGIVGVGAYLPEKILTNYDLEKMVETSDEWIITRTGIKERRIASDQDAASDLGARAAEVALKDAGLTPEAIELLICATITPDMLFPSTACFIQRKIKAKNAVCFDISAACTGYIYALNIAEHFLKNGTYRNALVVGTEKLSAITDWKDRSTCVLFGDGAGAVVLKKVKQGGIISTYLGSDGEQADLLKIPAGGSRMPASLSTVEARLHFLKMEGTELFKHAVRLMAEAAEKALAQAGLTCKDVAYLIPHQANIRILQAVAKKIGLPMEKIYLNIEKYGNMSSASTAVALYETVKFKKIKKGDIIVLVAFGSGLTWGATVIEWAQ